MYNPLHLDEDEIIIMGIIFVVCVLFIDAWIFTSDRYDQRPRDE